LPGLNRSPPRRFARLAWRFFVAPVASVGRSEVLVGAHRGERLAEHPIADAVVEHVGGCDIYGQVEELPGPG